MQDKAARVGDLATLLSALMTCLVNFALPLFLRQSRSHGRMTVFGLTIPRLWMTSQLLFATCMLCTLFVRSHVSGIALVAITGASWAFAIWVPFALIGVEIAELKLRRRGDGRHRIVMERDGDDGDGDSDGEKEEQAGAIMGIHNVAIAAPQIVAAVACSCLFRVFEALGVKDGLGWIMRAAGIAALGAAAMTRRLLEA